MKIPRKNSSGTGTARGETPVQYPARLVYECQGQREEERGTMAWLGSQSRPFAQGTPLPDGLYSK